MAQGRHKIKVGLDIGSDAVKIVEISVLDGKMSLGAAVLKKVRGETKEEIIGCIQEIASEAGILSKEVSISVSGPSVIVRFIVMPKMTEEDLRSAIKFEAEKHIPFNMAECIIAHHLIRHGRKDNKQGVILVAAKKDFVIERVKMVESAGLSVGIIDVDEFAVSNSFMANFPALGRDKTVALLDVGAKLTNLSIVCGGSILFARDISVGSRDFNASVSKAFGLDQRAAEDLRMTPGKKEAELSACTKTVCNNLCDDVKLSFDYYENQCGKGIDEVYLSGGGAAFKSFEAQLQEMLGLNPKRWNPLQFLDAGSSRTDLKAVDNIRSHFAVASGLALR